MRTSEQDLTVQRNALLVVTKLDRLARPLPDWGLADELTAKGVSLSLTRGQKPRASFPPMVELQPLRPRLRARARIPSSQRSLSRAFFWRYPATSG